MRLYFLKATWVAEKGKGGEEESDQTVLLSANTDINTIVQFDSLALYI